MRNINIIMLGGKMGSGKNFTATKLNEVLSNRGIEVHEVMFAKQLKEISYEIGQLFSDEMKNPQLVEREAFFEDKNDFTRKVLQNIGTDILRNRLGNDLWVDALWHHIKTEIIDKSKKDLVIIVTDWRFDNELVKLMTHMDVESLSDSVDDELFMFPFYITRPKLEANSESGNHISENGITDFSGVYRYENIDGKADENLKVIIGELIL